MLAALPDDAAALTGRGRLRAQAGDFHAAEIDFNHALRAKPGDADGLLARGQAMAAQGRLREALENINAAIQNAPDRGDAYTARAVLHRQMGNPDAATADDSVAERLQSGKLLD